jgi:hypothetical protein
VKDGRRVIRRCAIVGAALLGGCNSLRTVPGEPRDVMREIRPSDDIEVTSMRGPSYRMTRARIVGDSLVGVESMYSGTRVAIALGDIESVAVNQPNFTPPIVVTTLLVLLFLALALTYHD